MSDLELLQDYARAQSQAAFKTLVDRHVNLVYSAALRQVRSPQLAEEISQSVFLELSRRAAHFSNDQPIAAWLYVVTRRTAIDVIRRESRRLARETTAAEIAAMKTPSESWSKVEARLDEAMETLNATERSAIVLRFFENRSLRDVGIALGLSEDTAQKRVSRAIDRLRTSFASRGIAVGVSSLAADLSAHAIQTAPIGLGASISTATVVAPSLASAAAQLAMTASQKTFLGAVLAVVLSAGIYEATLYARQTAALTGLERQAGAITSKLKQARDEENTAANRLRSVEKQIDLRLAQGVAPPHNLALESLMRRWLENVDRMQRLLEQRPHLSIPELRFLTEGEWFEVAKSAKLGTDEGIRRALSDLRRSAEGTMASRLSAALREYVKASGGVLPDKLVQLVPFFALPVEPSLLDRYQLIQTGKVSDLPTSKRSEIIAVKVPADPEFDSYFAIGIATASGSPAMSYNVKAARQAFATAHAGTQPDTATELLPYLKWPVSEVSLRNFIADDEADIRVLETGSTQRSP